MIVIVGSLIVLGAVIGGFIMAGGNLGALIVVSEYVVICGSALGAIIIMAPKYVIIALIKQMLGTLKGSPYGRKAYEDLFKALYELFMIGRRNGMIALEEHVLTPETSSIFTKYPGFLKDHHAMAMLCGGLKPIIDGKVKPDQLKLLLDTELDTMEDEHHKPIDVLTKAADAMPGFGIVAAVLGIVITMGSIAGPVEMIGHHVAAALVGTFLGILISYGFLNPLCVNMAFVGSSELAFFKTISVAVVAFANGMAPIMAIEVARRGLTSDVKPTADDLEAMLKKATAAPQG
ncbi:MAG: flagellar motor stator protein MotA [Verrucomicrobia bacterium]|nr:flagellar motor stator protein MotA [Verrucomicrobiota bacterium]